MENKWDKRYADTAYIYGKTPNDYLKEKLKNLTPGKMLFPADGEGRNSVYAAQLGWATTSFDGSSEGKQKAKKLAAEHNVSIDYEVSAAKGVHYPKNTFDGISFIYAHFSANQRRAIHQELVKPLKKGGVLILEGFSKAHIKNQQENPQVGGPPIKAMLFDLEEIKKDFEGFEFIEAIEQEIQLNEGYKHVGQGTVVRLFALKRK